MQIEKSSAMNHNKSISIYSFRLEFKLHFNSRKDIRLNCIFCLLRLKYFKLVFLVKFLFKSSTWLTDLYMWTA
jgi:hypothetical protein